MAYKQVKNCDRSIIRRVWRYQRGNQNPHIAEKTDNTMAKRKGTKGKRTNDALQNIHIKLKIE